MADNRNRAVGHTSAKSGFAACEGQGDFLGGASGRRDFDDEGCGFRRDGLAAGGAASHYLGLLKSQHGLGSWRKKKGIANVRLLNGDVVAAEVHWYEAHGIGKVKFKVKEWL
ncbi:MAG: hypothetical protein Q8N33_04805 [Rhodocyclaceae bacterium]|nr:hypothetical protein [Rhodocyclaceae bacterium]